MTQVPHTRPRTGPTTITNTEVVALLERLLLPGYSIARTKHAWYLKKWESWISSTGPRMTWHDVDADRSLSALLERIADA